MKIIVLLHRFVCATAALLLSSGATADGVRLSEWRHYAPLHDFSAGQSLSQAVVTNNQEMGLFQRGFAGESDEGHCCRTVQSGGISHSRRRRLGGYSVKERWW